VILHSQLVVLRAFLEAFFSILCYRPCIFREGHTEPLEFRLVVQLFLTGRQSTHSVAIEGVSYIIYLEMCKIQ